MSDIVERLVRAELGPSASIWPHDRAVDSPMNVAINAALAEGRDDITIYWADPGVAEHFSLLDLIPPTVVFSVRRLELGGLLRSLMTTSSIDGELLEDVSERVAMSVMADWALQLGEGALASYLFTRATVDRSFFMPVPDMMSLEYADKDEAYMSVWFFGLLHEIGHVARPNGTPAVDWHSVDWRGFIASHIDSFEHYRPRGNQLVEDALAEPDSHPLGRNALSREVEADIFAARALAIATAQVMEREGSRGVNMVAFCEEIFLQFDAMVLLELVARSVRAASAPSSSSPQRRYDYVAASLGNPIAARIRGSILGSWLADRLSQGAMDGSVRQAFELITRTRSRQAPRNERVERGVARAMRHVSFTRERDIGLVARFAASLGDRVQGTVALTELRQFLARADALQCRHRDLETLRVMLHDPGAAVTSARSVERVGLVLGSFDDAGEFWPVATRDHTGTFIPVFESATTLDEYQKAIARHAPPGVEPKTCAIQALSDSDLLAVVAAMLPDDEHIRTVIAIEGSAAFERAIRLLFS